MIVVLKDLPVLPSTMFRYDNSISWNRIAPPAFWDTAAGLIRIDSKYRIEGWCRWLPDGVLRSSQKKNETIGLMLFSAKTGSVWEHYPYYEEEDLDEMKFQVSGYTK